MTSRPDRPELLDLADWRRQVADAYSEVRRLALDDPAVAWRRWRETREDLYRSHSQSPVRAAERASFRGRYWPYDPQLRFEVPIQSGDEIDQPGAGAARPDAGVAGPAGSRPIGFGASGPIAFGSPEPLGTAVSGSLATLALPVSTGGDLEFRRIGWLEVPFPAGRRRLGLYWMSGYAGGLFLPFRDGTNGRETYGAGRYLLDAAKSADLGGDLERGTLVLDFNFAFQPSCAFDPQWSCPLSPPENRLDIPIQAGERIG